MELRTYLQTIGAPRHQLSMRELRRLSDIDPHERGAFFDGWEAIPAERRREIVHAMVDLAEDNVDLQFQTVLLWCLEDGDAQVRSTAIEGLWESENPRVLRRLPEMLRNDADLAVREAAASGLGRFAYLAELGELDDDDAQLLLERLLDAIGNPDENLQVRRRALESAGYYAGEDDVVEQIEQAYVSDEFMLKESALVAMGRSMLPRWLPAIGRELESRSPALRYEAARAAGELGEDARPLIVRLARVVGDSDTEVALAAIWALGQIGGEAAQRALRDISKSDNEARAQAAADALAELTLDDGISGAVRGYRPRGDRNN